ncbi:ATP-binding protein [Bradyrhizobium prioriisuperbiae]|uniref:ATP-binding protein n=1 Tax=Bradyrhizobium prioriisuperbiae TaxID=2854389 RepID=UPI0028ECE1E7|nr:ATP-binding protein [Bradyrhizobium prioritasuperba]
MTRLVWRILPQTIRGQVSGLIIISLALVSVIIAGLVQFLPPSPRFIQTTSIVRAAIFSQLASALPDAEIDTLVTSAGNAGIRVEKASAAQLATSPTPVGQARLMAMLDRLSDAKEAVILRTAVALDDDVSMILVRLKQGNLVFRLPPDMGLFQVLTMRGAVIMMIVVILLIGPAIYAARWIISPLSSFANAARAFGLSMNDNQVLPEQGPREIVQVAQALNDMRTRIRSIVESRTRMLAAIGHDLRTPLTRLRLYAEWPSSAAVQENMIREIATIDNMLGETLTYLRDDRRVEATLSIDLPSLLQTICSEFSDVGHPVSYRGPDRVVYLCRPNALRRAMTNLIENGIKHGTEVWVSLRVRDSDEIEIAVADDGPGIPLEFREKAFEPFFKVDSSRAATARQSGFGLGLSIARDVVRDHAGEITLDDRAPQGLMVRIVLPPLKDSSCGDACSPALSAA